MSRPVSRRTVIGTAAAAAFAGSLPGGLGTALAAEPLTFGPAQRFGYEMLVARARSMAGQAYAMPYRPAPAVVEQIDYDAHGKIKFRNDRALNADGPGMYPVTFFHLGRYFQKSVKMHAVEGGQAREIRYSADYFDMPADSIARRMPADSGFAGFRLQETRTRSDWKTQDWVAFLGASYLRAIGALNQYGISARGVAIDVAAPTPEEFPDFTEFYFSSPTTDGEPVMVWALLDGPSVTGAFRFAIKRTEGVLMDIDAMMFARKDIFRFGVAPLTSMHWFGEHDRGGMVDWRPEVHDSDGLAMWNGRGERIWRVLNNPNRVVASSFVDENPRGFGLLQRDRNPDHYLDGVNYERRPSLWVEPRGDWGQGAIQLIEIPTDDEIHDNIVAFWVPKEPVKAGASFDFKYRLHWLADEPYPANNVAHVWATRVGRGGEPGKPRPRGVTKFVVEFEGDDVLGILKYGEIPSAVISASRGEISLVFVENVPWTRRWRAVFDLTAQGTDAVELRMYLKFGDKVLSETWLYQHLPRA